MENKHTVEFATLGDIYNWMGLVEVVKDNFPGLDDEESLLEYKNTLIKNINRKSALCVKSNSTIIGILIFSKKSMCLGCMAIHPEFRKKGIATLMINKMISLFPNKSKITVTTFRENDNRGLAPRNLYKKLGFQESELVIKFGCPQQNFILYKE